MSFKAVPNSKVVIRTRLVGTSTETYRQTALYLRTGSDVCYARSDKGFVALKKQGNRTSDSRVKWESVEIDGNVGDLNYSETGVMLYRLRD